MNQLLYRSTRPIELAASLSSLARGSGDPTHRVVGGTVWRTAATPAGPATLALTPAAGAVRASAWGPGARWLLAAVPDLLGARDTPAAFAPGHRLLAELHRRRPGLVLPRTGLVLEMLAAAVLEQKVTGAEAHLSWRQLVTRFGSSAPGPAPAGMAVAPDAAGWRAIPSWEWHRAGVDRRRAATIVGAAAVAGALERTLDRPREAAAALCSLPGVGPWTAAEVTQRAHADADAISVGDFHLPATVGWALTGKRTDDAGMLALLEPCRPQRYRAVRLLELARLGAPRRGPRVPLRSYRAM